LRHSRNSTFLARSRGQSACVTQRDVNAARGRARTDPFFRGLVRSGRRLDSAEANARSKSQLRRLPVLPPRSPPPSLLPPPPQPARSRSSRAGLAVNPGPVDFLYSDLCDLFLFLFVVSDDANSISVKPERRCSISMYFDRMGPCRLASLMRSIERFSARHAGYFSTANAESAFPESVELSGTRQGGGERDSETFSRVGTPGTTREKFQLASEAPQTSLGSAAQPTPCISARHNPPRVRDGARVAPGGFVRYAYRIIANRYRRIVPPFAVDWRDL